MLRKHTNRMCTIFYHILIASFHQCSGQETAHEQPPQGPHIPTPLWHSPRVTIILAAHSIAWFCLVLYFVQMESQTMFSSRLKPKAFLGTEGFEWSFLLPAPGRREHRTEGRFPVPQATWVPGQQMESPYRGWYWLDFKKRRHSLLTPVLSNSGFHPRYQEDPRGTAVTASPPGAGGLQNRGPSSPHVSWQDGRRTSLLQGWLWASVYLCLVCAGPGVGQLQPEGPCGVGRAGLLAAWSTLPCGPWGIYFLSQGWGGGCSS